MAAFAPVLLPEIDSRGIKPGELVALLSASAAMANRSPQPRADRDRVGDGISIAALFTGGLLPAAVLALALAAVAYFRSGARRCSWSSAPRARRRDSRASS